jgi:hypothetical protein
MKASESDAFFSSAFRKARNSDIKNGAPIRSKLRYFDDAKKYLGIRCFVVR